MSRCHIKLPLYNRDISNEGRCTFGTGWKIHRTDLGAMVGFLPHIQSLVWNLTCYALSRHTEVTQGIGVTSTMWSAAQGTFQTLGTHFILNGSRIPLDFLCFITQFRTRFIRLLEAHLHYIVSIKMSLLQYKCIKFPTSPIHLMSRMPYDRPDRKRNLRHHNTRGYLTFHFNWIPQLKQQILFAYNDWIYFYFLFWFFCFIYMCSLCWNKFQIKCIRQNKMGTKLGKTR